MKRACALLLLVLVTAFASAGARAFTFAQPKSSPAPVQTDFPTPSPAPAATASPAAETAVPPALTPAAEPSPSPAPEASPSPSPEPAPSAEPAETPLDMPASPSQDAAPASFPAVFGLPMEEETLPGYEPNPEWEEQLASFFKHSGAKTGVFILTRRGKPLAVYVAGNRDTHKNPTTLNTRFRIASVTKMVTAIGLMQLYEQDLIDLDDPINHYLPMQVTNPACPDHPITMRQVLSHTSTLKQSSRYLPDWEHLQKSNSVFYKNLVPGEKYYYANLNGGLAGAMIEALSGQSVNQYMTEHVFHPLGIDAAYSPNLLIDQDNIGALMTKGGTTTSNASRQLKAAAEYDDTCDPAKHTDRTSGALYISPWGLNRLMVTMALGGEYQGVRLLKEETIRLMEADQAWIEGSSVWGDSPYGLFLTHYTFGSSPWYGHQGRYNGLTSDAFYQPETGLTFVMVVNGYGGKSNDGLCNLARSCLTWADGFGMEEEDGI